jgi:tricarballylate dehydrogenase
MHEAPQDVLVESYPEEEYWQDLLKVTGGITNEDLARIAIRESSTFRTWMGKHGVNFQPPLSGTLHVARTNAFFMGGGKALVNAYYRSAEQMGVRIRYEAPVDELELDNGRFVAARVGQERIEARACVLAAGGFESNREWLREAWGQNERGEWPADNFLIRGTRFNRGVLIKFMMTAGADIIGDPTQAHCVAIDARAPLYDGGICTRVDCVSLGIMVNQNAERFYDEGEDFWPKRYAIWGRLVAAQPDQIAYIIFDATSLELFMPSLYPPVKAESIQELAGKLGLDPRALETTVETFNRATQPGTFDHTVLDDCHTEGLTPPKSHWARPIRTAPFYAYPVRPGITFTYLGTRVNKDARILMANGEPSANMFAAGEIMAGNVLGKGYAAGIGMTIGSVFGRVAGREAARNARN